VRTFPITDPPQREDRHTAALATETRGPAYQMTEDDRQADERESSRAHAYPDIHGLMTPWRSANFYAELAEAGVGNDLIPAWLSHAAHAAVAIDAVGFHDRRPEGRRYRSGRDAQRPYAGNEQAPDLDRYRFI
jgi:hypothetical protein